MVTARHRKGPPSQKMVCAQLSTLNQWRSEGGCIGDSCSPGTPGIGGRWTTWINV